MYIYKITHKDTGNVYIGQTTRSVAKRWKEHCRPSVLNAASCKYISHAIKKHGSESFSVEAIGQYMCHEDLDDAERYFIAYYDSVAPSGYNLDSGGNGKKEINTISKQKISVANKGKRNSVATEFKAGPRPHLVGAGNPMYGVTPMWAKPVLCVETGAVYKSTRHAATAFKCSRAAIIHVLRGRRQVTMGFTFKYAEAA